LWWRCWRFHQPLPSSGMHPQRQHRVVHCPRFATLVQRQRHLNPLPRARLALAERLCCFLQQPAQG
jgi:hypothetical protein